MRKVSTTVAMLFLLAAGCSQSGEDTAQLTDDRMTIVMRDTFFTPDDLTVRRGQTVSFRFENNGKLPHDAFIGDEEAQDMHEEKMRMSGDETPMPGDGEHGGGHAADDDDAVTVEPGKIETLTYRFTERGETLIGCHEPGHYAAGMRVVVTVR